MSYNPDRYYILSSEIVDKTLKYKIDKLILEVRKNRGCQIIVNGLIPTLKYYLRLINRLDDFIKIYSDYVKKDNEIKRIHKEKLNYFLSNLEI